MNHLFDGLVGGCDSDAVFAYLDDDRHYTYGDVLRVSARFANLLVALNVRPGDRVAVLVPKSIEAVMLYLACVRAGAIFLPLNDSYSPAEVSYFLDDSEPSLFVCDPARVNELSGIAEQRGIPVETMGIWKHGDSSCGTFLDEERLTTEKFENVERGADDLAAILYTSGTTGKPKGAMISHNNLLSNTEALVEAWRFTSSDILVHILPVFHTHGLFVATNVVLLSRCRMRFFQNFDVDSVIDCLGDCTSLMGVPTHYSRLTSDDRLTPELTSNMRLFVSGSAPLSSESSKKFELMTGHKILERYGMTETNMNTSNPYSGERRAGSVGVRLPNIDLRICDMETGSVVPSGEVGVIEVRGPNVFLGYWRQEEKTRESFRSDGFFVTGDMAREDEDGYIHIVGRESDLIISGGLNVYPKEVESAIEELSSVRECAVIGVPHPDFGEAVVALIVLDDEENKNSSSDDTLSNDILVHLSDCLAKYKHPKKFVFLGELPCNALGKVEKSRLRSDYSGLFGEGVTS